MNETSAQSSSKPLLSIVATARNDNHGGDLIGRMQIFVTGLIEQCERHGIDAELILVDWNPPDDKPHLCDALKWPSKPGRCRVRIVEVPPEVHLRMAHPTLPLFQMIAKNVGIRRARGKYVLATNIDIIFSDPVMQFLKSDQLKPGYMYRVNRFDVPGHVPGDVSLDEQLKFCQENIIRKHFFEGSFDCRTRKWSSWRENVQTRRGRFWNFLRRIRHRVKVTSRTLKNEAVNKAVYSKNLVLLYYRRHRNNVKNYAGHYYRKNRGRVRYAVNYVGHKYRVNRNHVRNYIGHYYRMVKGQVRSIMYRTLHTYRTHRNNVRNYLRHKYNTTVRNTVRTIKWHVQNVAHRSMNIVRRVGGTVRRWIHPTKGPKTWQFWLYLLLIPLRIVAYVVWVAWRIVRGCLHLLLRLLMKMAGANRVQSAIDHMRTNTFFNAFNVRWVHYRKLFKLKLRVFAMTARDRLPAWVDKSGLLAPRAFEETRLERIRFFEGRIARLQGLNISRQIPRLTSYQLLKREEARIARARQRKRQEIRERKRVRNLRRQRVKLKQRKIEDKFERQKRAAWTRWGKEKRKEFALQDRIARMQLEHQLREERRQRRIEEQVRQQEERAEHQRQRQLAREMAANGSLVAAQTVAATALLEHDGISTLGLNDGSQAEFDVVGYGMPSEVAVCEPGESADLPASTNVEVRRNGQHVDAAVENALVAAACCHSDEASTSSAECATAAASLASADAPASLQEPASASVEPAAGQSELPVQVAPVALPQKHEKLRLEWPYLHTNGCGDFTMLAYEDWAALEGYAEFEMYSMHIDSLFLVVGAHHGLKQFVLGNKAPIYHIEHGLGSGWTPEGEALLKQRLREAKIPQLSHDEFMDYDVQMARSGKAILFNGPNWGLADVDLPDFEII